MVFSADRITLPLITELLPVIDNLERATQAAEQSGNAGPLLDGVHMVINQFDAALAKSGCQKIKALGQEFDPHVHMALRQALPAIFQGGTFARARLARS